MNEELVKYENVAVSTRIRLARNLADYPFPNRLMKDVYGEEQAGEIIQLVAAKLGRIDAFKQYDMKGVSEGTASFLLERNLISKDLLSHRKIASVFVQTEENISVMVNEEDHLREQYFTKGFDLKGAYERIYGIDDVLSESMNLAYDSRFGYLTACPTNLGTGLRASVMLFLPALARGGALRELIPQLYGLGLTVRGVSGEGSAGDGDMYQISNEVTLGRSEENILAEVAEQVKKIVEFEIRERITMRDSGGIALKDKVLRSYGILANCCSIGEREFEARIYDVKLGLALGYFKEKDGEEDDRMAEIDDLAVEMSSPVLSRISGGSFSEEEKNVFRAECTGKKLRKMQFNR